jgi:hypothetical protein
MSFTFYNTIPAGPNNPSADQPLMLQNNIATEALIGVDHVSFNATPGGYHTVVHLVAQTGTPAPSGLTGELYTNTVNDGIINDEILFYQSGSGLVSQLTRNFKPINATNGATYLPGGLILQYGNITPIVPGGTVPITFPIAFPFACYTVVASPRTSSSIGGGNHDWDVGGLSKTGFTITASGHYNVGDIFYWIAIGN